MAKKILDKDSHDEKEGDLLYEEYLKDIGTGNIDFELIASSQMEARQTNDRKSKDSNNHLNVAVKVDRDTISKSHQGSGIRYGQGRKPCKRSRITFRKAWDVIDGLLF